MPVPEKNVLTFILIVDIILFCYVYKKIKALGVVEMAKPKRGKTIKTIKDWRGTCPVCKRTGVRLLYEATVEEAKLKVCKRCA